MRKTTAQSITNVKLPVGIFNLIKLSHKGFTQDFYLIDNTKELEYEGNTYLPYPFAVQVNSKKDLSGASLSLYNADRRIEEQLEYALEYAEEDIICEHRRVAVEMTQEYELRTGSVTDAVSYVVTAPEVDREAVICGLVLKNCLPYNYGGGTYNSVDFPNIYI